MNLSIKISAGLALAFAIVSTGCSTKSSNPVSADDSNSVNVHALYKADVAGLRLIDLNLVRNSVLSYEGQTNQLFSKIFGGTDADSVEQYYEARIHYAFTESDLQGAIQIPPSFPDQGWLTAPKDQSGISSKQIQIGALNISTLLWLEGAVAGTDVELFVNGEEIPITSTRTGVMVFGEGYKTTILDTTGTSYPLPTEYRQAILMHEARHSDCTDGLSGREVEIMRNATSTDDFLKQISLPHCGHTHVICPSGTYKGVAACDVERYGAYTVGAVFESAMIEAQTDEIARKILQITALDNESRFLDSGTRSPDELTPNMTSDGLTP